MPAKSAIILGAGPAGAVLAFLLARRGVPVTLLEKHPDFARSFRGEGMQPSGIEALRQMGLGAQVDQLPKSSIGSGEVFLDGKLCAKFKSGLLGGQVLLIPQPALLQMLTGEAKRFPSFQLAMGTNARDLLRDGNRIVGVRADTPDGPREFRADIVIGADGRHSTLRKHGPFEEHRDPQSFDLLWVELPAPDWWEPNSVRTEIAQGSFTGFMPSQQNQLRVAFVIKKGASKELRSRGAEAWTEELIRRTSPDMAKHLRAHRDAVSRATVLDVVVGRLKHWSAPGALLLGDAVHPMSPVGGQGINMAIRDAVVAANHLVPLLVAGADAASIDQAAAQVERERMPEVVAMQEHQRKQSELFFKPGFRTRTMIRLMPILARTGIFRLLMAKRAHAFAHGIVPVHLTA